MSLHLTSLPSFPNFRDSQTNQFLTSINRIFVYMPNNSNVQIPNILLHHEGFLEDLKGRLENWDAKKTIGDWFLECVRISRLHPLTYNNSFNFAFHRTRQNSFPHSLIDCSLQRSRWLTLIRALYETLSEQMRQSGWKTPNLSNLWLTWKIWNMRTKVSVCFVLKF